MFNSIGGGNIKRGGGGGEGNARGREGNRRNKFNFPRCLLVLENMVTGSHKK